MTMHYQQNKHATSRGQAVFLCTAESQKPRWHCTIKKVLLCCSGWILWHNKMNWRQKSWKGERQRTRCVYWAIIRSQWEKCGGGWSSSNQRRHGVPSEGDTRTRQCRNVDPNRECRSHSCSGIHKTAEGFSLLNVVNGTLQASFTRTR